VSQYQKGKTNLDFTEAGDSEWHRLGHMQVCTSLQTDNHTSTQSLKFFTGQLPFLPPNQQSQSTEGTSLTTAESGHADTETVHQQNLPVITWRCRPTQADLYVMPMQRRWLLFLLLYERQQR